ncbi:hypothetical protein ABI_31390 [Asticcacaulis biprosthecium C19]|uniref:Uncharacterized protein n=1 Tax=Asticcacaulis biprosthecium C19 TaxID=715226 RepID=F4QRK0_9CAUL|nr:hypothetical protein ABI_31390 [Asticcacaulis biprosthecium C19]
MFLFAICFPIFAAEFEKFKKKCGGMSKFQIGVRHPVEGNRAFPLENGTK